MSEQKVWVDKMPESCSDCPCCNYGNDDEKDYSCNLMKWDEDSLTDDNLINKRPENCPLHTTSELARQVCEKIRRKVDNISMHTTTKERLMIMCEEIQQEFEDENNKN